MPRQLSVRTLLAHGGDHIARHHPATETYHYPQHGHRGYCEWTLICGGSFTQRINGEQLNYGPGDLIFIAENTVHELWGQHLEFANAPVRLEVHRRLAELCDCAAWLAQAEASPLPPVRRLVGAEFLQARSCFQRASSRRSASATMQLVATLLDLMTAEGPPAVLPEWLRACLATIDAQLEQGVHVAELPIITGRSAAHIARSFRQYLDCTPSFWLNRRRCERAAEWLIADLSRPLVDIALSLGFASQSYFTRCFHRVYGVAPGKYRQYGRAAGI